MAISSVDVEDVLAQRPHPLTLAALQALNPAREPYRALLLQPTGVIEANSVRVGHADARLRADRKLCTVEREPEARERCWLVAASTLNLLDLVTAGDSLIRRRRTTLPVCSRRSRDTQGSESLWRVPQ